MNNTIKEYAEKYYIDFCNMFEITETGFLKSTKSKLQTIQNWYNQSYVLISLISGIPLSPIEFDLEGNKNINHQILLHVYSVSYIVLLQMSSTLSKEIPSQYKSTIQDIEYDE